MQPSTASAHLRIKHESPWLKIPDQVLEDICIKYALASHLPKISGPIPQIQGLKLIKDALQCTKCFAIRTTSKSILQHFSQDHPDSKKPSAFKTVNAQRFSAMPGSKTYFEVILPEEQNDDFQLNLSGLRNECDNLFDDFKQTEFDPRSVSPWLLSTHWHEHVSQYEWQQLRGLVQLPDKSDGDLEKIKPTVDAMMSQAMTLIEVSPVLSLQKLLSPDPVKEWVVRSNVNVTETTNSF